MILASSGSALVQSHSEGVTVMRLAIFVPKPPVFRPIDMTRVPRGLTRVMFSIVTGSRSPPFQPIDILDITGQASKWFNRFDAPLHGYGNEAHRFRLSMKTDFLKVSWHFGRGFTPKPYIPIRSNVLFMDRKLKELSKHWEVHEPLMVYTQETKVAIFALLDQVVNLLLNLENESANYEIKDLERADMEFKSIYKNLDM
jgi:hypothetical protein